jgi:hypothetical protein
MQAAFDALLAPTGFQRTRKMLWVQRHAHTASFVFLQREGAGRASIDTSLALRLQAGVRVLDSGFPALALNGPDSQDALLALRESRFHLRFNLASGHGSERCLTDLERYTAECCCRGSRVSPHPRHCWRHRHSYRPPACNAMPR